MVEARQNELDRVFDRHDTYVRFSPLLLSLCHLAVLVLTQYCRCAKPFSWRNSRHSFRTILRHVPHYACYVCSRSDRPAQAAKEDKSTVFCEVRSVPWILLASILWP